VRCSTTSEREPSIDSVFIRKTRPERDSRTPPFEKEESSTTVTRTYTPKASELQHDWVVIDATDIVLGRLASHKATFSPHMDGGDFVIIVNAEKVALTGKKLDLKLAYRHSGYPGGLSVTNYSEMLEKHPTRAVEKAIRGMLPKNSLGRAQLLKLKVYAGPEHPHSAQQPKPYTLSQVAQ
jgi:large subunit ribosomal protein L13